MTARINRLTALDRMFFRQETPAWPGHFGGLALVEAGSLLDGAGRLRLEEVRARLDRRLAQVPQFRRRLLVPRPFGGPALWVDDRAFDIRHHVIERTVRPPGLEVDLLETAAEIYAAPLDRGHPLWELRFLTGLADGRVGVLLKVHHSIADGLAALAVLGSLIDVQPDAADPLPEPWQPAPDPPTRALIRDNLSSRLHTLGHAGGSLRHPTRVAADARSALRTAQEAFAQTAATNTSLNEVVRRGRRVRYLRVDLGAMKNLAHQHGGKVNDVVLDLWAGGLRHLLQSRDESVTGVELIATMTMSLRATDGSQEGGNQVGFIQLPLPVWEPDPSQRLDLIIRTTQEAKALQRPAAMAGFIALMSGAPLVRYLSSRQRTVNVKVSNVIGPPEPVYLLGSRITEMLPIMRLLGNVGLALCVLSYAGQMYLAVTADATGFPDIDVLMEGMRAEWSSLTDEPTRAPTRGPAHRRGERRPRKRATVGLAAPR
jgi:diacylglycerol O-acyltransferase